MGLGAQFCTLLEVWVLGVGMSMFDVQTSLYAEDRGIQVPMALEHVSIVGTQCRVPSTDGLEHVGVSLGHMTY